MCDSCQPVSLLSFASQRSCFTVLHDCLMRRRGGKFLCWALIGVMKGDIEGYLPHSLLAPAFKLRRLVLVFFAKVRRPWRSLSMCK